MTANNDSLPDLGLVSGPTSQYVFYLLATVLFFAAVYHLQHDTSTKFDLVNPRGRFEFTTSRVKKDFLDDAEDLIADRFRKQPGKPFRVYADHGEMTIFPPEFAEVFRSDPRLSFDKPIAKVRGRPPLFFRDGDDLLTTIFAVYAFRLPRLRWHQSWRTFRDLAQRP